MKSVFLDFEKTCRQTMRAYPAAFTNIDLYKNSKTAGLLK
jgi:hypothetical protein